MDLLDIVLSQIYFLTLNEKLSLRKKLGNVEELELLSADDICLMVGRSIKTQNWNSKKFIEAAKKSSAIIQKFRIGAVCYRDERYPSLLREILNPPYILYYRGDISVLNKTCVGIVGTRSICKETALAAFNFARDACDNGVTVVSGLASGVDAWSHKGSLSVSGDNKGKTCAVLPCGIDMVVPSSHKVLASKILNQGGCLVSEYSPGNGAEPWRYVQRNRIIAGVSEGIVVVQAPPKSGALITANFAIENNRDLYFHTAAFCAESKIISDSVRIKLNKDPKNQKKLIKAAEDYVEEGATVVADYADYAERRKYPIDINNKNNGQLNLF